AAAARLARQYWDSRREFLVESVSVAEAVARGRRIDGGPILLLNTADTTGGGAAGDSIEGARGLLAAGRAEASRAGGGSTLGRFFSSPPRTQPVAAPRAIASKWSAGSSPPASRSRASPWSR